MNNKAKAVGIIFLTTIAIVAAALITNQSSELLMQNPKAVDSMRTRQVQVVLEVK